MPYQLVFVSGKETQFNVRAIVRIHEDGKWEVKRVAQDVVRNDQFVTAPRGWSVNQEDMFYDFGLGGNAGRGITQRMQKLANIKFFRAIMIHAYLRVLKCKLLIYKMRYAA